MAVGAEVAELDPNALVAVTTTRRVDPKHLIGNGYVDREDLSEVLDAFAHVFSLHLEHGVALNLHLSGTLIEAVAWHDPGFFRGVHALRERELVELVGSTYSQHVMAVASDELNRRQLDEALGLYRRHLGVEPEEIRGFWAPERVWDTAAMAALLTGPDLANGGYRYVLVDERLA